MRRAPAVIAAVAGDAAGLEATVTGIGACTPVRHLVIVLAGKGQWASRQGAVSQAGPFVALDRLVRLCCDHLIPTHPDPDICTHDLAVTLLQDPLLIVQAQQVLWSEF